MKKSVLAGYTGLLLCSPVFAATEIQTDDVVVTASRVPQPRESATADISVISREEIERAGQSTLVELLQTQPGVEINNNGGPGKLSGIFLRGTNSSHVVVLVDGMRISSATAGTTTFENLPLAQIERIEILRGPASSLYGQDAIGGVIQIFTRNGQGQPAFTAAIGYGSYATKTADAGISGSLNGTSFALNASSYDTRGFSAYKTSNPQFNDKDGYRNLAISGSLSQKIADGHELGLQFMQSEGHTNYDSRFNFTDFGDHANLKQLSYALTSNNQFTQYWLSKLRLGQSSDEAENFSEVNIFNPVSRSLFKTTQRQYSWQNDLTLPLGTLTLLYDRLEERVKSTTEFNKTARDNDGYTVSYLLNSGPHAFQTSYRRDHNSQFGNNDTGGIGYGFSFTPNWRASASYGTAFKAPTFNDLYYPDFFGMPTSNPNLKPEKSRNLEASLRYEEPTRSASATVYQNKIRDLIALDAAFVPFNASRVRILGLTLAASQRWDDWQMKGSVDLQSPRDEETGNLLVRRANRHADFSLGRDWGHWRFASEVVASSARYNDSANTQRLAGYALVNLTADYTINPEWKLQGRVNNLLDKDYALAFDGDPKAGGYVYNTPGANLFISLRYSPVK